MARKFRSRPRIPGKKAPPVHLLDQFSQADVVTWRRQADAELKYANRIFFHLEAERSLHATAIRDSLAAARPLSLELSGWTRIVDYRYSLEPLSAAGSLRKSGRFNVGGDVDPYRFPPFPALYLAEDYQTAYAEKFGGPPTAGKSTMTGEAFALRQPSSFTSVRLSGQLRQLFDLTESSSLRRFIKVISRFQMTAELISLAQEATIAKPYLIETVRQLKSQLLASDWRLNPSQFGIPAHPQIFGRLVREAGFEGVLYSSVRGPKRCAAVFPDNLAQGESFLELADPAPGAVRHRRLDATSWQQLSSRK